MSQLESSSQARMERDWSVLPPELLQAIADKIISVCDYIRFRAVCHSWRSTSSPRHLHLPWLMLPYEINSNDDFTRLFYDLSASKIRRLDLPELGMELGVELEFDDHIEDFTYSNGCLYATTMSGIVVVYDLNNRSRAFLNYGIGQNGMTYLVDGVHGDILFFCRVPTFVDGVFVVEIKNAVYKLNYEREPELIEVRNIGQNVLFVDNYGHAISFSTANVQLAEWGSNCLFFNCISTDKTMARCRNNKIKLVGLDDGTVTDIIGDLCSFQYNDCFQQSLWLTPSLF